jgi:DNA polymerase-1
MAAKKGASKRNLPWFIVNPDPSIYLSNNYVVIDLETTNADFGNPCVEENRLLLAVACRYKRTEGGCEETEKEYLKVWESEYEQNRLRAWIDEADFVVAHGAKFELGWFKRMGIDLHQILVWDTLLGKYVWDGNRKSKRDLDSLCEFYGVEPKESFVKELIKLGVKTEEIPQDWLEEYCTQDVDSTWEVFLKQREELRDLGLLPVMFTRCLATPMLADLEPNGMQLDADRVNQLFNKVNYEHQIHTAALRECSEGINENSPKQLAEFLYDRLGFREPTDFRGNPVRTKSGKRVTGKEYLKLLKPRNSAQSRFLGCYQKQNEINNILVKYVKKFKDCVDESNGLLLARFNQAVTATHRLSSSGGAYKIQFQNMARWLKPMFMPRYEGWSMGEVDFEQLEFRIAVWLGNDAVGRQKIAEKFDVHSFTASIVFKKTWNELGADRYKPGCDELRTAAKPHTFKPLYGGQSGTPDEVAYYTAFREMYPDIAKTQEGWVREVLKTKQLRLPHGFVFYWPFAKATHTGYVTHTAEIYNYPVQHFATAEIVLIGVTYLWHMMYVEQMQSFLINTVHDSAIGEIHPDEKELFKQLAVKACDEMVVKYLKAVYNIDFDIPLAVDATFGSHWAEKKGWADKYLNPDKPLV